MDRDTCNDILLSVVVVIVSDTTDGRCDLAHLMGCLEALEQQESAPALEIIVPYHMSVEGIEDLRSRFPQVVFVPCEDLKTFTGKGGSREHHDELRARGMAAARGDIIALLEDHGRPDRRWAAEMVEAHQQDYAAIGGAIENGISRPLNWAVYFCDFGKYQNPVAEGESYIASDANISYKRPALETVRSSWQEIFHERIVNAELSSSGQQLALCPRAIVFQHRNNLRLWNSLKERFIWGRSYAATRSEAFGRLKRLMYAFLAPALPVLLLLRMTATVVKKKRCIGPFVYSFPLTAMLSASWSLGEAFGYSFGLGKEAKTTAVKQMLCSSSESQ